MSEKNVAIMYDFDKTLCTTDMQNYSFIPNLGLEPGEFWSITDAIAKRYGVEKILSYMYVMIKECQEKGIPLTREYLYSLGKDIKLYPGVNTWFERINSYGKSLGLKVEHYIISSGTKEIILGSPIAKYFKKIYACEFAYDAQTKQAMWPAFAINYTQKTQYFFRISKGALDEHNDFDINSKTKSKRIPYANMIYLGDGMTDIPAMILGKKNGGTSIALYPHGKKEYVLPLLKEQRVNYICKADYSPNSPLDQVIKKTLEVISINNNLNKIAKKPLTKEDTNN